MWSARRNNIDTRKILSKLTMENQITGLIYDIQSFSVQDGPGIRTTVFLKGCPLRCPWCHSPESQAFYPQLSWIAMRCIGTDSCEESCRKACPKNAIEKGEVGTNAQTKEPIQYVHVKRELCDNCGKCTEECYPQALFLSGKRYTVEDIMKKARADKVFFNKSGGGVTISGGEALSQPDFTLALLKELKKENFNTALDTTGFAPWEAIKQTLEYTDLYLYDLKHMDSTKHEQTIGVPNGQILENARRIAESGGKLQIRIPVIPCFNDDSENITKTAKFCKELEEAVTLVQLLPYHNLGVMKYLRIGDDAPVEMTPPSNEKMQELKNIFESYGIEVMIH